MKLLEANYLRSYAIISIVIWHCLVCPLNAWGLIDPTTGGRLVSVLARFVIPDASMPLFTFISGYLFAYLYQKNKEKYGQFKPFLKAKIKRLVIPFLVLGTLVNLTVPERYPIQILSGEGSHLWFCMMLFWCFMIRWTVLKINNKVVSMLMLLLSIVAIVYSKGNNWYLPEFPYSLFGIRHAVFFYLYFVMGDWLYRNKGKLDSFVEEKSSWLRLIMLSGIYAVWVLASLLKIPYVSDVLALTSSVYFIVLIYLWVSKLISIDWLKPNKFIETLCIYSFGIYVFHEWISWGLYHQPFFFGLFEKYTIAYALIFTIMDFAVSFALTHFALKTKVGKYLLL